MLASAQLLEIVSTQQLSTPTNEAFKVAGFSPKGDYLLLTNDVNSGLIHYDITTGAIIPITDSDGAGWAVQISQDGQEIVYRERYMNVDQTLRNNIMTYTIKAQKRAMIAKGQRDLSKLVPVNQTNTVSINGNLHIVLMRNGKTSILAPNGIDEAYNWVSISPDGTKLLYYVSGKGCYTCDLNGKNVHYITLDCRAPQWYDNHTIIGMADEDDGTYLTASAIVAYTLDGKSQILVNKEQMAIYPYAVEGKIVFSNAGGEIYMMQVKLQPCNTILLLHASAVPMGQ